MLAVALSPATTDGASVSAKVAGIILANISSGAGEVNFLSLTHFYGTFSLAAWGSGTGGAGLIGAGAYALATNELAISPRTALLTSALLPILMLLAFFALLPREPLLKASRGGQEVRRLSADGDDNDQGTREITGLLDTPDNRIHHEPVQSGAGSIIRDVRIKIACAKPLIIPYMIPLFLVYLAEYTINQGVASTLLFPLRDTPFEHYRAFYPTYSALYQAGVFISRSSLALFQIRNLYTPTFLQILNLVLLTAQAVWFFVPSVYLIFALVFWEGLLGGLVYVSTYALVREEVREEHREFSLGAVAVSDSCGIFCAGLLGVGMESALCDWQVGQGRDWCRRL